MQKLSSSEIQVKIEELINKMTLEEKVSMIHGNGLFRTEGIERLGIPVLTMSDGPMGVRKEFKNSVWEAIDNNDDYVTYFPCNMAVASTWNPERAYEFGEGLGAEARGRGKDVILAPGFNIIRTPLCGRNFEYMSEDPYLISKMVVPFVKGVQTQDTAACVKHFAANNQEFERLSINVEMGDRALHEIYLPAFKAAVEEGDSYTIMGAYNKLRGEHCSHSQFLLNKILREAWGYDGVVISDWGAVHDTEEAVQSSLDIEMSVTDNFDEYYMANPLIQKVKNGSISEELIDEKVERILKLMFKLNIFSEERKRGAYNTSKHREIALNLARESIILLKNEKNILPLQDKNLKTLAVIGENADKQHSNGGGSAEIKALYELTPLMGLKMRLGGNTKVTYAKGYSSDPNKKNELLKEAVELAKNSGTVLLFLGLNHDFDVEGKDREDMKLPYGQDELVKEILKVNKDAIIINISGSPIDMEEWIEVANTVVHSWYTGIEGGYAMAEVLLGDVNPSGKLSVTFPKKLEDSPAHSIGDFPGIDTVEYKEGIFVGYRYFDTNNIEPRFCFGHGLSYTSFEYSDLNISVKGSEVEVSLNVKNGGNSAGAETVQLYLSDLEASAPRPSKELKGFKKVYLKPGDSQKLELKLNEEDLSFYDDKLGAWTYEKGEFKVFIGSSIKDIRLEGVFNYE